MSEDPKPPMLPGQPPKSPGNGRRKRPNPMPKRPRGRQHELTQEKVDNIVTLVSGMQTPLDAARTLGVPKQTMHYWMHRGRRALTRRVVPESERLYADLLDRCEESVAKSKVFVINALREKIAADPKLGTWWLEKRFPEEYGQQVRVMIERVGAEIDRKIGVLQSRLPPEVFEQILEALAADEADDLGGAGRAQLVEGQVVDVGKE